MLIFALGILYFLIGASLVKPWLNPISAMAFQWVIVGIFQFSFSTRYNSVSNETYGLLATFMSLLTVGIYISYRATQNQRNSSQIYHTYPLTPFLRLSTFLAVILTPFILLRIWQIGNSGPTTNIFVNIRYLTSTGQVSLGLFNYIMLASLVLMGTLGCIYYSGNKHARWLFYLVFLCVFLSNAATLARGMMVTVVLVYLVITYIYGKLSKAKIFLAVLLPLFGFIAITIVLNKSSSTLAKTFADYFVPPIVAFDQSINTPGIYDQYSSVLYSFYTILNSFGFHINTVSYVMPFVDTPITTNLYTAMLPYYSYGGIFGIVSAALFIGFIHGAIWKRSKSESMFFKVLYAFSFIPLTSHFGSESYVTLLSYWLQVIFWLWIFCPRKTVPLLNKSAPKLDEGRFEINLVSSKPSSLWYK